MAAKRTRFLSYFLVIFSGTSLLLLASVQSEDVDKAVCDRWAAMAIQLTGGGRLQNCTNSRTDECTRIDCSGTVRFSHELLPGTLDKPIEIDYCFGVQLNSCKDPVSMDFYLQVPKNNNFSKALRIKHDDVVPFPGLKYPLPRNLGSASPVFHFEFEQEDDGDIKLSVTSRIELDTVFGKISPESLSLNLVDDETIHAKPCDKPAVHDNSTEPPADFASLACVPMTQPTVPASHIQPPDIPSATYLKTCDFVNQFCGPREYCNLEKKICVCNSDSKLSANSDSCVSLSQLNQPCRETDDCGYNEICRIPDGAPRDAQALCFCKSGYSYHVRRSMCALTRPGEATDKPVTYPPPTLHTVTPAAKKDSNDATDDNDAESKHVEEHNLPMIIGGVLAVVVVVSFVIWVVIFYQRRRRRNAEERGRSSEAGVSLLSSTDDDGDNLVM